MNNYYDKILFDFPERNWECFDEIFKNESKSQKTGSGVARSRFLCTRNIVKFNLAKIKTHCQSAPMAIQFCTRKQNYEIMKKYKKHKIQKKN